jgi:hypothetical protein
MYEHEFHKAVIHELKRIADTFEKLYNLAVKEEEKTPTKLDVSWKVKGVYKMSTAAIPLNLDATSNAVGSVTELNSDGSVYVYNPANIQAAVQDPTVVSAVVNSTTGAVTVTPLKVGSTQVAVNDSGTGISSPSYTFTVTQPTTGPTPASLSVAWAVTT